MKIVAYVIQCGMSLIGPFASADEAARALNVIARADGTLSIRPVEEAPVVPTRYKKGES
jgi:hypothetical protein